MAPTTRTSKSPTTSAAPTPSSNDDYYYYYYYDDEGTEKTRHHDNEDSSPHWSAVGASIPIVAVILIVAVLAAIAVVVLPRFIRSTRESWAEGKRPSSPSGPTDDAWVSSGTVMMNQQWMSTLIKHADGPEYDAQCDVVHSSMHRKDYENDYMEVDAIEMSQLVNEDF